MQKVGDCLYHAGGRTSEKFTSLSVEVYGLQYSNWLKQEEIKFFKLTMIKRRRN